MVVPHGWVYRSHVIDGHRQRAFPECVVGAQDELTFQGDFIFLQVRLHGHRDARACFQDGFGKD